MWPGRRAEVIGKRAFAVKAEVEIIEAGESLKWIMSVAYSCELRHRIEYNGFMAMAFYGIGIGSR